ncbi:DUF393 domain-containing protein [Thalassococcus sp. CAU 1522]|uniref:DUF393 domain-containing protein n=1 Tax=Thalassococcus arenae TaxID=2851652 RepID=A0ABS6N6K9_9RHOB|nr:DUF393 domain-containing protein [Thalassococcus arenae]MBV2359658.1 DUF393 domain-containing protein [Thalassococcus arenae]
MSKDITVIYNDTCPICAREVAGYRRLAEKTGGDIAFSGLSEGAFGDYGLDRNSAARRFHVVADGRLVGGVEAFALLWDRLPRLRWLARLVRLPVIAPSARLVYDHVLAPVLFALHRRRERLGKARRIG